MFKIHAGDFLKGGEGSIMLGALSLPVRHGLLGDKRDVMSASEITMVEVATEESVKRLAGTVGWGAAGAVLLGPLGLLASALVGGRGKEITFIAVLQDGRKFLATADRKTFIKVQAAALE